MQETKFEKNSNFHHIVPVKVYIAVFLALMVLTVLTVAVAYVDLKYFNVPVALGIATLKATLVVLFFMHVKYSGKLVQFCIISGILFFILLILGTMQDYWTREAIRLESAPAAAELPVPPGEPPATTGLPPH